MAAKKGRGERKLPVQQLTILAMCRFAEPLASTSLYPYLPEMVASFNVPHNEIGKWAGLCAAIFSLCQAAVGIPWGRFSDIYGRKPAIMMGLFFTMLTSLMWGFSKSLPMAIVARALAGMVNGNVGIIRTAVAEMVPYKELQPRAFSLMPLVWNIGSIFGPSIGGALANPYNVQPGEKRPNPNLLEIFPFALPNLVSAGFFTIGITIGILYLEESLESRKHRRDYGLVVGQGINRFFRRIYMSIMVMVGLRSAADQRAEQVAVAHETVQLLKTEDAEGLHPKTAREIAPKQPPPTLREVMNPQATMDLIVYTALAMHSMGFDQVLPVFLQHALLSDPASTPFSPPLRFAGGFGMQAYQIGILNTCNGVFAMVLQFVVFPPVARKYGVLPCLKVVAWIYPIMYALTPFTVLFPTQATRIAACFGLMLIKLVAGVFAFPCTTILLTNSASSMRTLATLNGAATMFSAIGRAAGPALAGGVFTFGVEHGYVIAPFWLLSAVAVLAAIPVFWLIEGEGFGGDDTVVDEDDDNDDDNEDHDEAETLIPSDSDLRPASPSPASQTVFKNPALTTTIVPEALANSATSGTFLALPNSQKSLSLSSSPPRSPSPASRRTHLGTATSSAIDDLPVDESADMHAHAQDPIAHRVARRFHSPIGMGEHGISRRYSSNLGQNLGGSGNLGGE